MYQNVHYPVATLAEGAVKSPGLCYIQYFRKEDVLAWPAFDPQTGVLAAAVTLKPGAYIYLCNSIDPSRAFTETAKDTLAGPYFDSTVKGSLMGSAAAHFLTIGTMIHHQWGLIVKDKNGVTRLLGSEDACAELIPDYSSGAGTDSRKTELTWKWQHTQPAPIYTATAFQIIIGGLQITAGCIQHIQSFKVGQPGAPMNQGDTLYINNLIANKKVLVIADGMALPVDDFSGAIDWSLSIDRHVEKALASNTINFIGSAMTDETIELYAYT